VSARAVRGLYVLADDDPRWHRDPVEQAQAALAGGASVVQLRAKHATDRQVLSWAAAILELCRAHAALCFVNDRFDLALAAGADGVHLGQDDLPPAKIPPHARARLRIGRSTHTLEQAVAACDEPVDYVAFGPVFGTRSKESPYDARGLEALAAVARRVAPRPCVAIGGIDVECAQATLRTGVAALCVLSAVVAAADMEQAARALVRAITQAGDATPALR
jgi:thiamine-phosphate pyrophosphorylase